MTAVNGMQTMPAAGNNLTSMRPWMLHHRMLNRMNRSCRPPRMACAAELRHRRVRRVHLLRVQPARGQVRGR